MLRSLREDKQIALINEELKSIQTLYDKGLALKSQLLALQRTASDLGGQRGEHLAEIARAQQNIAETQEQLANSNAQHLTQTVSALRDAQNKLADVNQQIVAASDTSHRLDVTAPVDGTIITIQRGSIGGVIRPGETIMEILPDADQLVIEAHVRPEDIDSVGPGKSARVRLTAYSREAHIEFLRAKSRKYRLTGSSMTNPGGRITWRAYWWMPNR